jgi:hypothetical protein
MTQRRDAYRGVYQGRACAQPAGSTHLINSVNAASFLLRRCPIVVRTVVRTIEIADIAIRFRNRRTRDQVKLFPHFGEPRTAVFAVEKIADGGHDRPPSFARHHIIISVQVHYVIEITASPATLRRLKAKRKPNGEEFDRAGLTCVSGIYQEKMTTRRAQDNSSRRAQSAPPLCRSPAIARSAT